LFQFVSFSFPLYFGYNLQEAQLLQKGRATLRVVENFAVTQDHLNLHSWIGCV